MRTLPFELRDIFRSLRRDRGYAATVVLTLALTVGATTAVFSIVNGVLLKPLAYRESHRLVQLAENWREVDAKPFPMNERHFEYWREHATSFDSMAQYIVLPDNLTGPGEAAQISVARTSGSLFNVLQVRTALGRPLAPTDEPSSSPDVAVIGDALWRQRFGGDPAAVGRTVVIGGRPHTVVGILPAGFSLPERGRLVDTVDAFVAIRMDAERVGWVGDHNNFALGRLKAGVRAEEAAAELDVLQGQVSVRASADAHERVTLSSVVTPLTETVTGSSRRALLLLLGSIAAVLLIACSNLASLSLTRAIGRLREAAIRSSLGASRRRLVTRALIEQLVLSILGGALGLFVAWAALGVFVRTAPLDLPRVNEVALDAGVLAFTAAVALLAGTIVALLPAWRIGRADVQDRLRAGALSTTSDRGSLRTRAALLALQVALSMMLLVVTGLLGASFLRLMAVDRGFDSRGVLVVPVAMPADRYADDVARVSAYDRLLAAIHTLPGVISATTASVLPLSGEGQVNFIVPEGRVVPRSEQPSANFRFVAPGYFSTLGVAITRGRSFTDTERGADRLTPSLVSEATAARLWPGEDALGKRFSRGGPGEQGFEIVGIVANARLTSVERTPPLMVYVPYWWRNRASVTVLVKAAGDPAALLSPIRDAVRRLDPGIAIGRVRSMDDVVVSAFAARFYQVRLFIAFGIVALCIATLGVYTITAYEVSRRRREMNIRVALGAQRRQVMALVLRQGTTAVLAGLLAGTAGALLGGSLVASLLYDVTPRDPAIIGGIVTLVALVGAAACFIAARQGLVVDPANALREE